MDTHRSRRLKRTNLFLMRVWTEEARDGSGQAEWHGTVQRVVDGESHQFDNWQDLIDVLHELLSQAKDGPK